MPYIEKITRAGMAVFVDRCQSPRYHAKGIKRGKRMEDTKLAQELVNARKTHRSIAVAIDASFHPGDYHFVLTYEYGRRPATPELAQQDLRNWLREIKKEAKKHGVVIKYVVGTEIGSRGGLHHHVIMNRISRDWICDLWEYGQVKFGKNLDQTGEWSKLASYIVKCKTQWKKNKCKGRGWSSSRNLNRPEPEVRIISNRQQYRENPRPWKGYYIDKEKTRQGVHELTGWPYLSYVMVEIPGRRVDEDVGTDIHRDRYHRKI